MGYQLDRDFSFPIGDFLAKKSISDTVQFIDKFSTKLPHLVEGISCDISINTGDEKTLLLTLHDISRGEEVTCDICGEAMTFEGHIEEMFIKAYGDYDEKNLKEDEISFSTKSGRIDVEDLFYEIIRSSDPVRHMCTKCRQNERKIISKSSKNEGENTIKRIVNK